MHDGETIDLFAPFGAFPGASRHKNHLIGTVDSNNIGNNDNADTIIAGTIAKAGDGGGGVEPHQVDNLELNGGDNDNDNHIADNVDGFLDDFLALVDESGSIGEGMDDLMDTGGNGSGNGDIAEEDLVWLEDMDLSAFLPPPAAQDAAPAGANNPPSSSAHEIDPVPEPAVVVENGAAATTVVAAAVASQTEGSSPRAGGEGLSVADSSATAGASPSSAGFSAAAGAAASTAPAFAEGGGGAGRNNNSVAHDAGVDAAGVVSRKEQLRRQKVARYLAKKKNRQWSKAKASSYQSRQRVANSRPRHKGRFLPLESDFVSIEELQRRQRAIMKQMQEKAAAAKATATAGAGAPSSPPAPEFGTQVAI